MKKISAGLFMALLTVGLMSARGDDKKVEDKSDLKAPLEQVDQIVRQRRLEAMSSMKLSTRPD